MMDQHEHPQQSKQVPSPLYQELHMQQQGQRQEQQQRQQQTTLPYPYMPSSALMPHHLSSLTNEVRPHNATMDEARDTSGMEGMETGGDSNGPVKCLLCGGRSFSTKSNLTRHMRSIHASSMLEKRRYCCVYCPKSYTRNSDLVSHIESAHQGKASYSCEICSKTFSRKCYQKAHLKHSHGIIDRQAAPKRSAPTKKRDPNAAPIPRLPRLPRMPLPPPITIPGGQQVLDLRERRAPSSNNKKKREAARALEEAIDLEKTLKAVAALSGMLAMRNEDHKGTGATPSPDGGGVEGVQEASAGGETDLSNSAHSLALAHSREGAAGGAVAATFTTASASAATAAAAAAAAAIEGALQTKRKAADANLPEGQAREEGENAAPLPVTIENGQQESSKATPEVVVKEPAPGTVSIQKELAPAGGGEGSLNAVGRVPV